MYRGVYGGGVLLFDLVLEGLGGKAGGVDPCISSFEYPRSTSAVPPFCCCCWSRISRE